MENVTVGIPFYNAEHTLADAVRSVFAQSAKDWELILVDDGSSDGSLSIARSIQDSRVKVVSDGINHGLPHRLNQIARMAQGRYLARMDADDIMHPERLRKQVEYLSANPEVDVVDTEAYIINVSGLLTGLRSLPQIDCSTLSVMKNSLMFHPTVLGRVEWFRNNPYDESFMRAEDYELWCRTCKFSTFARLQQPLYYYRENHKDPKAYLRYYIENSRFYRKSLLLHGPDAVGWPGTLRLLFYSFCKAEIYRVATTLGKQNLLINKRSCLVDKQEELAAYDALRMSLDTPVMGLEQEGR